MKTTLFLLQPFPGWTPGTEFEYEDAPACAEASHSFFSHLRQSYLYSSALQSALPMSH